MTQEKIKVSKEEVIAEIVERSDMHDTRLSQQQVDKLRGMPVIETKIRKSEDGKWIISETIIKTIKPAAYYKAIMNQEGGESQ